MSRPSILVVEDNAVLQRVIQLLGRRFGVDTDVVSNGVDALAIYRTNARQYSLILMDWRMPDMDGLECTRRIRAVESTTGRHVPIIAMTANAEAEDKQSCLSAGMDDYVSKPFNSEQFREILHRWIPDGQLPQAI